jgi:hypothetical protein
MKRIILLMILLVIVVAIFVGAQTSTFEKKRRRILDGMTELIDEQVEDGNYRCCIEPACTMCFMGNWMWDDGICRCDDMILEGDFDKVCPQCQKGIDEGQCESSETVCDFEVT